MLLRTQTWLETRDAQRPRLDSLPALAVWAGPAGAHINYERRVRHVAGLLAAIACPANLDSVLVAVESDCKMILECYPIIWSDFLSALCCTCCLVHDCLLFVVVHLCRETVLFRPAGAVSMAAKWSRSARASCTTCRSGSASAHSFKNSS